MKLLKKICTYISIFFTVVAIIAVSVILFYFRVKSSEKNKEHVKKNEDTLKKTKEKEAQIEKTIDSLNNRLHKLKSIKH